MQILIDADNFESLNVTCGSMGDELRICVQLSVAYREAGCHWGLGDTNFEPLDSGCLGRGTKLD